MTDELPSEPDPELISYVELNDAPPEVVFVAVVLVLVLLAVEIFRVWVA